MSEEQLWIKKQLKYFVKDIGDGGTPSRENSRNFGGNIPWVVISDIQRKIYKTKENLSVRGLASCTSKLWPLNTVILSTGATIGKVGIAYVELATKQGITGIVANEKILPKFLYYELLFKKPNVIAWAQGSTFAEIRVPILEKIPLKVPKSIRLQEKIYKILEKIDQTIEKTEALIEKYQQIKTGLMHDLFTRGITADGKLRPPKEQAPELYKETPIGWIPKEWDFDLLDAVKDSIVDGPFGSNLKTEHYVIDAGVRVVRLQNIQSTMYNDTDRAYVSHDHANFLIRNKVIPSDILIAGLGDDKYPVGRSCQYPLDLPAAINKADCFRLRCKLEKWSNEFIMYYMNTSGARHQIRKYEQGVTRPRINLSNIKRVLLPTPGIKEQEAISLQLKTIEMKINNEERTKTKLLQQKSGLMHDLLTGKVQVKVDENEAINAN